MRRLVVGAAALLATAGAPTPPEKVVRLGDTEAVTVNGVPARLTIDPAAPGLPMVTPGIAAAAKMKGGGLIGFGVAYSVGNETVYGRTAVTRFGAGPAPGKRRVGWTPRPYRAGVDAVMGPAGLDEPVVRFVLHAPAANERSGAAELPRDGGLFSQWFGMAARIDVGGRPLRVRFAPYQPRTIANAAAARALADALGGRMTGETRSELIAFGIERPVRRMTLSRPLGVGPLFLDSVEVRTADTGSVARIPEATDAPPPAADPDEVVVTAKGKRPRPGVLTLGMDVLARCSSIVFDKPAKLVRLSCG